MCLDWILASTEYIEFVYMMLEFKVFPHTSCFLDFLTTFRARKTGTGKITNTTRVRPTSTAVRAVTTMIRLEARTREA
jgi:hypothetical protein